MFSRAVLPFVLALCCLTAAVHAAEVNLKGVLLDIPPGWTRQSDGPGAAFTRQLALRPDGTARFVAMMMVVGPLDGALTSFAANFDALPGFIKAMPPRKASDRTDGITVAGHRILHEVRCCEHTEGVGMQLLTAGIASAQRQIYLVLLLMGDDHEAERIARLEFQTIVRTLRLDPSDKPFAIIPRQGDGGLDGVFETQKQGLRPNPFGTMDTTWENHQAQFDPSGLFSNEIPTNGRSVAGFCLSQPGECGFYALKGGGLFSAPSQIEVAKLDEFGAIETTVEDFARDGEDMTIGEAFYARLKPFARGHRFDGAWRFDFAQAGQGAFSSGSVTVQRVLVLMPDGRFRTSGWSSLSSSGGGIDHSTSGGDASSSGSYAVDGYSLTLQPDQGPEEALTIYATDSSSDEELIIDGLSYQKDR